MAYLYMTRYEKLVIKLPAHFSCPFPKSVANNEINVLKELCVNAFLCPSIVLKHKIFSNAVSCIILLFWLSEASKILLKYNSSD